MEIKPFGGQEAVESVIAAAARAVESEHYTEPQQEHLENGIPRMNLGFAGEDRYSYFLALENDKVVGVAGFQTESGTVAGIFVHPDYQEKGFGSALLRRLEKEAVKHELDCLEVPASLDAVDFYQRNGYEITEDIVQDVEGVEIEMKQMEKKLSK